MQYNIAINSAYSIFTAFKSWWGRYRTQSSFETTYQNLGPLTVIKINLNSITTKYMLKIQFYVILISYETVMVNKKYIFYVHAFLERVWFFLFIFQCLLLFLNKKKTFRRKNIFSRNKCFGIEIWDKKFSLSIILFG